MLEDCDPVTVSLGGGGVGRAVILFIDDDVRVMLADRECVPEAVDDFDTPVLDVVPDVDGDLLDDSVPGELPLAVPDLLVLTVVVVVPLDVVVLERVPEFVTVDVTVDVRLSLLEEVSVELCVLVFVCVILTVFVDELDVDIEFRVVPVIPLAVDVRVTADNVGDRVVRGVELIEELDVPDRVPVLLPEVDILDVDVLEEDELSVLFADRVELLDAHTDQLEVLVNNDVDVQRLVDV